MNPRTNYEMAEKDLEEIMEACKPTPVMFLSGGASIGGSQQENANDAWAKLGKKMGFDSMTVKPSNKGQRFFTAVSSETDVQKQAREQRQAEEKRQAQLKELQSNIEKDKREIFKLTELPIISKDGNQICATLPDFINLQESPAGFGDTEDDAIDSLREELLV